MKNVLLGSFEEYVLLVIAVLEDNAYGNSIRKELKSRLNRNPSIGALHSAFYRLEEKGYVTSRTGGATSTRGGRRKKFFQITATGRKALQSQMNQRSKLYELIFEV